MLAFACPVCDRLVAFENTRCLNCHTSIGHDFARSEMAAVATGPAQATSPLLLLRFDNAELAACNWLVREAGVRS